MNTDARSLETRLADLRAKQAAPKCPTCGCTALHPCAMELSGNETAVCARPAGPGDTCGACKSPELRATPEAHILRALDAARGTP